MPTLMPGTSRAVVALRMDGSSTVVTIPRQILTYLGWLPGDDTVIELLEDNTLRVRPFTKDDVPDRRAPRLLYNYSEPEKA